MQHSKGENKSILHTRDIVVYVRVTCKNGLNAMKTSGFKADEHNIQLDFVLK